MKITQLLFLLGFAHVFAQAPVGETLIRSGSLVHDDIWYAKAETSGGNIVVEGVETSYARIEIYASGAGSKSQLEKCITQYYDLQVLVKGGVLTAIAKLKPSAKQEPAIKISFHLYLGESVSTDLRTSGGGNISITGLDGNIGATTIMGSVSASHIRGALKASTIGGNLHLNSLICSLDARTNGGNIDANIEKLGKYALLHGSGAGYISLQLPEGAGVDLELHGRPAKLSPMNQFKGDASESHLVGELNGGGTHVFVDGINIPVYVTLR
jgi:hypothetical protein